MSELTNILNEFPNFVDGLGSQFHEMPHFEDPLIGAVAAVALTAAVIVPFKLMGKKAQREHSKEFDQQFNSLTEEQKDNLDESIKSVKITEEQKLPRISNIGRKLNKGGRRLYLPVDLAVFGLASTLGILVANPTVEQVQVSQSAVAIMSATDSMLYTKDMGNNQSRFSSAIDALKNSSYNGNLGIVTYDQNSVVNAQLSPKSSINFNSISYSNISHFNPGGNLDSAILNAEQLLTSSSAYKSSKKGEILIISDGTLVNSSTSQKIDSLISSIKGLNVEVIVPGNTGSTYQLASGTNSFGSDVKPENLTFKEANPPVVVNNQASLNQAVSNDLAKTPYGISKKEKPWILGPLTSLTIAGAGLFILIRDRLRKVI